LQAFHEEFARYENFFVLNPLTEAELSHVAFTKNLDRVRNESEFVCLFVLS
jgi:hypothetical protein